MEKDPRYFATKTLFEMGHIRKLEDLFNYLPKTVLCNDLGLNVKRFNTMLEDPKSFRAGDLIRIAELYEIPFVAIAQFVKDACDDKD